MIFQVSGTCALCAVLNAFVCSEFGRELCLRVFYKDLTSAQRVVLNTNKSLIDHALRERDLGEFFLSILYNRIIKEECVLETIRGRPDISNAKETDFVATLADNLWTTKRKKYYHAFFFRLMPVLLRSTGIGKYGSRIDFDLPDPMHDSASCMFKYDDSGNSHRSDVKRRLDTVTKYMKYFNYVPAFCNIIFVLIDDNTNQQDKFAHAIAGVYDSKQNPYIIDSNGIVAPFDWANLTTNISDLYKSALRYDPHITWTLDRIFTVYKNENFKQS